MKYVLKKVESINNLKGAIVSFLKVVLSVVVLSIICGCSVTIEKVNTDKFKGKISYFKDEQTGLCFAAVAMKKGAMTSFNNQNGVTFTCVPCEKVEGQLK